MTAPGSPGATPDRLLLDHEADAAARARAFARARLQDAPHLWDDVQLVVSELVTNALLHGTPPVEVLVLPRGRGARVEVVDASARRLVRPVPSSDAMTGRGLALVQALSTDWGVDLLPEGGKVVWAELAPAAADPGAPGGVDEPDLAALLDAWPDEEPEEPVFTVRLGAVPTDLLLDAKRHIDNVLRELQLERAAERQGSTLPEEFQALIDTVTGSFAQARASIKEQAAAAAARGDRQTELVLTLPASSAAAGEQYLAALDQADRYSRSLRLLTLETPPLHRLFRRWYVTALVDQLRALTSGQSARQPLPFVHVLADEVDALTAPRPPDGEPERAGAGHVHAPGDVHVHTHDDGSDHTHDDVHVDVHGQVWVGGQQERQLLSLADAARAIAGARSVEDLLEVVTEAARTVLGAHQAVGTRLYGSSWEGASTYVSLSDKYADFRDYDVVPKGLGVLNAVTRDNRALRLTGEELVAHPDYRGLRDAPGHPPLPDYLAAPFLSRDGANIGLLQVADKDDGTPFTAGDEAVCVQLALMVSSALEHLEVGRELDSALQRLRREQEIIDALHGVGRAVISHLEHADVVQVVTDAATGMTGAQFGAFFYNVLDDDGESYALYSISGVPREAFSRFPLPRNTEVFAPTFAGSAVVRLDDVTADPRYGRSAPHHGMPEGHLPVRSYLAVPVTLSDGEVVGGLFFGHEDVGVFGEDAERLAVGIAGYAAVALQNGRLYDAARRESRAKQAVAAALEKPLRPPPLPNVPGVELASLFQPFTGAGGLAGDFYDAFLLADGRWLLALGDVSGKGPEAAAVTGLLRHTLWAAAQLSTDTDAVLEVVNAALAREDTERFATLVLAVVETTEDGLRVDARWAGHPAGLVLGGDRPDRVERVSGGGLPVGLFSPAAAEPVRFTLRPGQTLLLHTDGLLERDGTVLDDDDLDALVVQHAALPPDELLATVAGAIDARHGRRDDVAALALRVRATS